MASKGAQNGAQNEPKSNRKINIKFEGFQDPLGSVLGLSWVVLGSILGSKIIRIHLFLNVFVNISFLEPSWIRLGPVLGRFGVDLGVKNHQNSLAFKGFPGAL